MKVFAGHEYSGILTSDGKLLTFGLGASGQLGHLDQENKPFEMLYVPKRVDKLDAYFVEDVSFGSFHVLAIARKKLDVSSDGEQFELDDQRVLFSWGVNKQGQ